MLRTILHSITIIKSFTAGPPGAFTFIKVISSIYLFYDRTTSKPASLKQSLLIEPPLINKIFQLNPHTESCFTAAPFHTPQSSSSNTIKLSTDPKVINTDNPIQFASQCPTKTSKPRHIKPKHSSLPMGVKIFPS